MLIDSHCHLNYAGLVEQQADVLTRARGAGVTGFLNISTRESEWMDVVGVAEREPDVWASIGIHPHEADAHPETDAERLVAAAAHPRVVGIGETGLDYYYDHSDRARQQASFRAHIAAARETGLPLIVHTRDAEADTAAILSEEMGKGVFTGVIHCFTASQEFAEIALGLGFYISLSGILTFKNARDLQATAATFAAGGPAARRDRRAVPGAGAAPRARLRARLRRRHARVPGAAARHGHRASERNDFVQLPVAVRQSPPVKVTILGSGTSSGVPRIGNVWGSCDPADPRNRRRRASILVETETTRILVDTSPDMREQLLSAGVEAIDAVIWTHDHADHCHGIDDLRQLYHARGRPVDGYARPATLAALATRFAYAFDGRDGYPPVVSGSALPDRLRIGDIDIGCTDQPHGLITSAGLRFEADGQAIGYATDISGFTDAMAELYSGLDIWVVDALRRQPHPTHPHLSQTLGWIETCRPKARDPEPHGSFDGFREPGRRAAARGRAGL